MLYTSWITSCNMWSTAGIYPWTTAAFNIRKWSSSAPNPLNTIIFAGDTNIPPKDKDIRQRHKPFFRKRIRSCKILMNGLFQKSSLSQSWKKRNFRIFHKASKRNDLPIALPKFFINNQVIKRQSSIKFVGILLHETLSWNEHLKLTENQIPKNIRLIYKAKPYLNKDSLLVLYFSYIHSYINYSNLVSGSTNIIYLRKISSQEKHALRLIHNKNSFYHSKELFETCGVLNVYKLNLLVLRFLYTKQNCSAIIPWKVWAAF